MNVYCIPGLAADSRIFKNLELPTFCRVVHIEWVPAEVEESLTSYAHKLCAQIDASKPFALLGLSLGGMIAVEMARMVKPLLTILISSVPVSSQLPPYYYWAGAINLHKVVPVRFLQQASILKRLFSVGSLEEKALLKDMIRKSDAQMIRWGLTAIINWKRTEPTENLIHLHGNRDMILPIRFIKPTHIIKKGGHLMVLNKAAEINSLLQKIFEPFVEPQEVVC